MINATIKKTVTDAIRAEDTAGRKWLEAGTACAAQYKTRDSLEAIRAEFLDAVIYPAMGDAAIKTMRVDVPKLNSKEDIGASTELRAEWATIRDAKKTVRGKGSVYFGRVLKYAFPQVEAEGEDAASSKSDVQKFIESVNTAVTRGQKLETPPAHFAAAMQHLINAQKILLGSA